MNVWLDTHKGRWILKDVRGSVLETYPPTLQAAIELGLRLKDRARYPHGYIATEAAKQLYTVLKANEDARNVPMLPDLPPNLYDHQKISASFLDPHPNACLFLEMGLGKTRIVIEYLKILRRTAPKLRTLVFAPLSVLSTWEREARKWTEIFSPDWMTVAIASGTREAKQNNIQLGRDITVTNYETLLTNFDDLLCERFDILVFDESTHIKNEKSERSKRAYLLAQQPYVKRRIGMTGTPLVKDLQDIFGQFKVISPETFGTKRKNFLNEFFVLDPYGNVLEYRSLQNLTRKIYSVAIQYVKSEALDLPEKIYEERYVFLSTDQQDAYDELVRTTMLNLDDGTTLTTTNILAEYVKLTQITSGFVLDKDGTPHRFSHNPKIAALKELLQEANGNGKAIIFVNFKEEVAILSENRDLQEYQPVFIHGEISTADRERAIDQFQNNPDCRLLIGNLAATAFGLTLTAATNVIYFSNSWRLELRLQSEDRAHRIGQRFPVTIVDILAIQTIDETILESLREKAQLASRVTRSEWEKTTRGQKIGNIPLDTIAP